jgi:hypothetical protein
MQNDIHSASCVCHSIFIPPNTNTTPPSRTHTIETPPAKPEANSPAALPDFTTRILASFSLIQYQVRLLSIQPFPHLAQRAFTLSQSLRPDASNPISSHRLSKCLSFSPKPQILWPTCPPKRSDHPMARPCGAADTPTAFVRRPPKDLHLQ